jgi:hypothetical protein
VNWSDLPQDRDQWRVLVSTAIKLRVPQNIGDFLRSFIPGGFSRRAQLHGVSYLFVIDVVKLRLLRTIH